MKTATITTSRGVIKLELFDKDCPNVVANFEKLAKNGTYSGVRFHRVIADFMIQTGDPQSKDEKLKSRWGTGDAGYKIDCEIVPSIGHQKGSLAMAHAGTCKHDRATGQRTSGQCSNGSQFYITHKATGWLDGVHTVFGKVLEGQNVVDAVQQGDTITSVAVTG